jgi:NAD(P)-dependent dehydrogenase (short-subunit alcohol dehydrogenase family)
MTERLKDKVAIVTGGASGIGEATVIRFIEEGAKVVITDRNAVGGQALANRFGNIARFIHHDVRSEEDWRAVIQKTLETFGALNILVNNAGYGILKSIEGTTLEDWREMFSVHAEGAFIGCSLALPEMLKSGTGSIVNVSSSSAEFGMSGVLPYSAAKASQQGLTRSVATHCFVNGYPINCNAILPGGVETPLLRDAIDGWAKELNLSDSQPYRKTLGRAVDLANTILFFASDEGRYVNGQLLLVDGGRNHSVLTHKDHLAHLRAKEVLTGSAPTGSPVGHATSQ